MFCSARPATLDGGMKNAPSKRGSTPKPFKSSSSSLPPLAANFWEIGTYKRCVRRIDDGGAMIDDFKMMLQERAAIERRYATLLKDWKKKWETKLEKGPEDKESSLYTAWQDVLSEATQTSLTHADMDNKLTDLASNQVNTWRKTHFAKGKLGRHKAAKKAEEGYEKAQRHYAKLTTKFEKVHKSYLQAKDTALALNKKQREAQLSDDERFKLVEKTNKISMSRDQLQFQCRQHLRQLEEDVPRYQEGMREAFTFCQDVEQKRIEFLKHALGLYVQSLEAGVKADSVQAALAAIAPVDSANDVARYGQKYGVGMPLYLPTVDSVPKLAHGLPTIASSDTMSKAASTHEDENSDDDDWEQATVPPPPSSHATTIALYDYTAEDKEELSFVAGDVITQLEAKDEQGWAKGMDTAGRIGFYPAHYVEANGETKSQTASEAVPSNESAT